MNFKEEFQRISKIINDMPIEEFENMLFDCGLGIIGSSEESDFVKYFTMDCLATGGNYVRKNQGFSQGNYQKFNEFSFGGQEVA